MGEVMPAVKALIEENGKILALENDIPGKGTLWNLPGGRIEFGESPEEALRREVDEEVSLDVDVGRPVGTYHFFFDGNQVVLTVFECEVSGGEVSIENPVDEHITGWDWVSPRELVERPMEESLENLLRDHYRMGEKLVRDNIPDIMRQDGEVPEIAEVEDGKVGHYLVDKMVEELDEFLRGEDMEELADLLEVMERYVEVEGPGWEELVRVKEEKAAERGGFDQNIVLVGTEERG